MRRRLASCMLEGLRGVGDWIFPRRCPGCHTVLGCSEIGLICRSCRSFFVPLARDLCPVCGEPGRCGVGDQPCARCRDGRAFDSLRAVGVYQEQPVQSILLAFKHGGWTELAPWLGQRMARAARDFWGDGAHQGVVAVPLHWRRRRARGYDQAALLARAMARASGLPLLDVLRRTRATLPQEGGIEARKANVEQAFRVRRPERVRDRSILLLDDVATTGATIEVCARMLRAAGAVRVDALTLARAVLRV